MYTVGETVVNWPSDYYGEFSYYDDYDYEPYELNDYDREMMGDYPDDWCGHCGGPCEL